MEVVDTSAGWTFGGLGGPGFSRGASPPRQAKARKKTTAVTTTTLIVLGCYHGWRSVSGHDYDIAMPAMRGAPELGDDPMDDLTDGFEASLIAARRALAAVLTDVSGISLE